LYLIAFLLLIASLAAQKQRTEPTPKIICTPPNLKVLKMVRPSFPAEAKAKNVYGRVAVEAEIDREGRPQAVRVIKGDPVITAAVVKAVKQWRWKPLKLNGQPVEVSTTIVVDFEPR
jgi:TonB family protein